MEDIINMKTGSSFFNQNFITMHYIMSFQKFKSGCSEAGQQLNENGTMANSFQKEESISVIKSVGAAGDFFF